jgi:ABC-type lipoprotein release transport system permease subunit
MGALLFGITPGDPLTFAAAGGLTLLMTLAGCLMPALRAMRVTPMAVLKSE